MSRQRVDGEPGFILHAYPYSETSLVLDVLSRGFGRLPILARGARRPRSSLRGVLLAFQPLELSWFGGGEVRTLARAEWHGGQPLLAGTGLMLGYYANELVQRLLPREDAHPGLFEGYADTLQRLAQPAAAAAGGHAATLRRFELVLLRELGYGPQLERDADSGARLRPEMTYHYFAERGPVAEASAAPRAAGAQELRGVHGKTLLDLARGEYADARTLFESRALMRMLINHHLSGQPLQSRRIFKELQEL